MADFPIDPKMILKNIQDGLLIVDAKGHIVWTNDVFRQMIGRQGETIEGRLCPDLGVGSFCKDHCPLGFETGESCKIDAHFNVKVDAKEGKGAPGAYCFITSPIRDEQGQVVGFMENFRGMEQVREVILQLEEVNEAINAERNKTEDLVDSMADGVFSVDQELRIRRFSRNMVEIFGIPAKGAIGKPCREVLRGTLCDTDCPLVWSREHGSPVTGCREHLRARDGRLIPVSITTGLLRNEPDFERGIFGVVTDRSEIETLREELEGRKSFHEMIGASAPMRALFQQIEAVAPTDATVLISGESGTGKELIARAIHRVSQRKDGPFVSVNCAALVDTLLESELFGHVKGSFTGAVRDHKGKFEQAEGGTLFLDEVGDTSPALQAKLLRALQEKIIEPVGSGVSRKVDVRILAATNKDLTEAVQQDRFRTDLYYRLSVIPILAPALRERPEDIPLLVHHFIRKYSAIHFRDKDESFEGVSERALALLMKYDWPGNVRELEHAVEYALISSDRGRIERSFLPNPIRSLSPVVAEERPASVSAKTPLPGGLLAESAPGKDTEESERQELLKLLESRRWNLGQTATDLGISRTTLWRRMKRFGISKV